MKKQLLLLSFFVAVCTLPAQEATPGSRTIDLTNIGYPFGVCKFPDARIEFLDPGRLLVSFPLHSSSCLTPGPFQTQQRHAVVLDAAGKLLHAMDLQPSQFVIAGPNGHILLPSANGLSILGDDFSAIQMLPWPKEAEIDPKSYWTLVGKNISLTPSRGGFVIQGFYPKYLAAYFEGNPLKQVIATAACSPSVEAVTDGGFACIELSPKSKIAVHLVNASWQLEDARFGAGDWKWAALPTPDTALLLTSKFKLFELQRGGNRRELADLHWLAPGLWNSALTYTVTSRDTHRVLVTSWGCWFPLNDTTGIGYYERILVLDYLTGAVIWKKKYSIGSDIAISPDGHSLAVREKNRLELVTLP